LPVGGAAEVLHEIGLVRGSGTGHAGTGPRAAAVRPAAVPPPRHRATGAWLAHLFALEQERQVVVHHGCVTVARAADGGATEIRAEQTESGADNRG
jgi:hypothetical protein